MAMSDAERSRLYRERKGAIPRGDLQPCGTAAAAKRHKRAGEPMCVPCKVAWDRYNREYQRRRRSKLA